MDFHGIVDGMSFEGRFHVINGKGKTRAIHIASRAFVNVGKDAGNAVGNDSQKARSFKCFVKSGRRFFLVEVSKEDTEKRVKGPKKNPSSQLTFLS